MNYEYFTNLKNGVRMLSKAIDSLQLVFFLKCLIFRRSIFKF